MTDESLVRICPECKGDGIAERFLGHVYLEECEDCQECGGEGFVPDPLNGKLKSHFWECIRCGRMVPLDIDDNCPVCGWSLPELEEVLGHE